MIVGAMMRREGATDTICATLSGFGFLLESFAAFFEVAVAALGVLEQTPSLAGQVPVFFRWGADVVQDARTVAHDTIVRTERVVSVCDVREIITVRARVEETGQNGRRSPALTLWRTWVGRRQSSSTLEHIFEWWLRGRATAELSLRRGEPKLYILSEFERRGNREDSGTGAGSGVAFRVYLRSEIVTVTTASPFTRRSAVGDPLRPAADRATPSAPHRLSYPLIDAAQLATTGQPSPNYIIFQRISQFPHSSAGSPFVFSAHVCPKHLSFSDLSLFVPHTVRTWRFSPRGGVFVSLLFLAWRLPLNGLILVLAWPPSPGPLPKSGIPAPQLRFDSGPPLFSLSGLRGLYFSITVDDIPSLVSCFLCPLRRLRPVLAPNTILACPRALGYIQRIHETLRHSHQASR